MIKSYPRGFLYALQPQMVPESYEASQVLRGLWFDPDWAHVEASRGGARLVVLGSCVPVDGPFDALRDLMEALSQGEEQLLRRLDHYAGRHVVLFQTTPGPVKICTDAAGVRTVFFAPGVAAAQAALVAANITPRPAARSFPHQWGWPGRGTPFEGVKLLTPNHLLDTSDWSTPRFYPREPIGQMSVAEAAGSISRQVITALRQFEGPLLMGLTGGIDSRTTLALLGASRVRAETFTYINGESAKRDAVMAARLAEAAKVKHWVMPCERNVAPVRIEHQYRTCSYYNRARLVVEAMRRNAVATRSTFLTSNLLEIGRAFYPNHNIHRRPYDAAAATNLYLNLARQRQIWSAIEAYGLDAYHEEVLTAFEDFYAASSMDGAFAVLDPYDVFYWEHRMGAWHSIMAAERDVACDTFIPFNARSIFEAMLSVPFTARKSAAVFEHIIRTHAPGLMDFPINPKEV